MTAAPPATLGQYIGHREWLTAKRRERDDLGWASGHISAWLNEPGIGAAGGISFGLVASAGQSSLDFATVKHAPSPVAQPDYAALGLGSGAEAEGRN